MDELAFLTDWDLEAINETPTTTNTNTYFSQLFSELQHDELLFGNFPEFSEATNVLIDEFQELCKPFYPLSSQTIVTNSMIIPKQHEEVKEIKASDEKAASQDLQVSTVSKCKKSKKNKNKSIVKKVTAMDGTLCDAWAWRKYGQKPIKGSPYPRSYYRCSSSKGCSAKKQVEKNHLDPRVYLVTYTAEHNHPQPTRRNSLAGSTRKNNLSVTHSPTAAPMVKIEDEVTVMTSVQMMEKDEEDQHLLEWLEGAQLCDDGWIPKKELDEYFIGLDNYQ
ncbi:probable WRKY transcription factor 29 [Vicia villosa]|uniref:probable WRKY transcription factor 29 n=1 Tax=Vicia villosa TaxID=3911 RepID=UPI00273B4D96|nr:probable WRKY transcription factor 29 [Vicia villosa]